MADADDDLIDSLEKQGVSREYARRAASHLRQQGVNPDTVDLAAEYDSSLGAGENVSNFKRNYAGEGAEHASKGYNQGYEKHLSNAQDEELLGERRHGGYTPKHEAIPARGQVGGKRPAWEKQRSPRNAEATSSQSPKEPDFLTRTKSFIGDLQRGHEQRVLASQKERALRAAQKVEAETKKLVVVRTEAQARKMEQERRYLERANRQSIPFVGGLLAGSNRARDTGNSPLRQALLGGNSPNRSRSDAPMGRAAWSNSRNETRSPMMSVLSGQSTEPRRKPKYVNFVQHGRIVRVDVNNQQSQNTQETRSPLQAAMFGGNTQETRSPMLTVLTGGSSGKSAQSPLQRAMSGSKNSQGRLGRLLLGRR